jgi:low temperature requirement protein LtrA
MLFEFENKRKPLSAKDKYRKRILAYAAYGILFILFSLVLGAVGYRFLLGISWVDAFYNASMILTGMGPAIELKDDASKIFVTFYCIYSGVAFLTAVGVIFAPLLHRWLHKLHAPLQDN